MERTIKHRDLMVLDGPLLFGYRSELSPLATSRPHPWRGKKHRDVYNTQHVCYTGTHTACMYVVCMVITYSIRHRVSSEFIGSRNCVPMAFTAYRASKPQGSSERVLPWQITMDQLILASLSHTHYWYEVGMLKVPAVLYRDMHIIQGYTYDTGT